MIPQSPDIAGLPEMKQTDQPVTETESLPDRETMYAALVQRDSSYEGTFVAAIRTTGIFCRPSCSRL